MLLLLLSLSLVVSVATTVGVPFGSVVDSTGSVCDSSVDVVGIVMYVVEIGVGDCVVVGGVGAGVSPGFVGGAVVVLVDGEVVVGLVMTGVGVVVV